MKSRAKGVNYELAIIKSFKEELGYDEAVSSRFESKRTDDAGVDICYTQPFNVQCKAVEKLPTSYHAILERMPDKGINILFHKKNRQGTVVSMGEKDFYKIVKLLIENDLMDKL